MSFLRWILAGGCWWALALAGPAESAPTEPAEAPPAAAAPSGMAEAGPVSPAAEAARRELLEADRACAALAREKGLEAVCDTWLADEFMTSHARRTPLPGRAALRQALAARPDWRLVWQPSRAFAAASGEMGYTAGEFVLEPAGVSGDAAPQRGQYLAIWRRQEDGGWRCAFHAGLSAWLGRARAAGESGPDAAPAPAPTPGGAPSPE